MTTTISGPNNAFPSGYTVAPGETLEFDPNADTTLEVTKNLVNLGTLKMRPANPGIDHVLRFVGINEANFVGGGNAVLDTDPGLWVMEDGVLDIQGATKTGWVQANVSITTGQTVITLDQAPVGWQIGDEVVICPSRLLTTSPKLADLRAEFDERIIQSISGTTLTLTQAVSKDHPVVVYENGDTYRPEILNLTRNVKIEGQPGGKTHILNHGSQPQNFNYVEMRHLGPQKLNAQGVMDGVAGRYGFHLHKPHMGSPGGLFNGLVIRDCFFRAFVPHDYHNSTFYDAIAFNINGHAYWWDPDSETNGVVFDRCVAAYVWAINGQAEFGRLSGWELGHTQALTSEVKNCRAIGVSGGGDSSGYGWPQVAVEGTGLSAGVWKFDVFNIAHHCQNGIFVWQNASELHQIKNFHAYRNFGPGIQHGAYANVYDYTNIFLHENGTTTNASSSSTAVTDHVSSKMGGAPLIHRWENVHMDGGGVSRHALSLPGRPLSVFGGPPVLRLNEVYKDYTHAQAIYIQVHSDPAARAGFRQDIVRAVVEPLGSGPRDLEPTDFIMNATITGPMTVDSLIRVQRADGTAYQIDETGAVSVIAAFYSTTTARQLAGTTSGAAGGSSTLQVTPPGGTARNLSGTAAGTADGNAELRITPPTGTGHQLSGTSTAFAGGDGMLRAGPAEGIVHSGVGSGSARGAGVAISTAALQGIVVQTAGIAQPSLTLNSVEFVWPNPTQVGNLLILLVGVNQHGALNTTINTPTGFTPVPGGQVFLADGARSEVFYKENADIQQSITVSLSGPAPFAVIGVEVDGAGLLDQFAQASGNSETIDSGTTPPTLQADEYLVAILTNKTNYGQSAPTNGFEQVLTIEVPTEGTIHKQKLRSGLYHKRQIAAGSASVQASLAVAWPWVGKIATFRLGGVVHIASGVGRSISVGKGTALFAIGANSGYAPSIAKSLAQGSAIWSATATGRATASGAGVSTVAFTATASGIAKASASAKAVAVWGARGGGSGEAEGVGTLGAISGNGVGSASGSGIAVGVAIWRAIATGRAFSSGLGVAAAPVIPVVQFKVKVASIGSAGIGAVVLDDVPCHYANVRYALDSPGAADFRLYIEHSDVTKANFAVGQREIHVYKGGALIWSGWLSGPIGVAGYYVELAAKGFWELFRNRYVDDPNNLADLHYEGVAQEVIAGGLLSHAQGQSGGNYGIAIAPTGSGRALDKVYCIKEHANVGSEVEALANAVGGFDFEITPEKVWKTYTPKKSGSTGVMLDNDDILMDGFRYEADASDTLTDVIGVGNADCDTHITVRQSGSAGFLKQQAFVSVDSNEVQEVTDAASAILYAGQNALEQVTIPVKPGVLNWGSFHDKLGQSIGVNISGWGFTDINRSYRIIGIEVRAEAPRWRERVTITADSEL